MSVERESIGGLEYWNNEKVLKRFFDKVEKTDTCWNWTAYCWKSGYGCFSVSHRDSQRAHRVSYEIYHKKKIAEDLYILHSCHNRKCVNPLHLREGTAQENSNDMIIAGRNSIVITSTLTEQDVRDIRKMSKIYKQKYIAELYNLTRHSIRNIVNRITWNHIED